MDYDDRGQPQREPGDGLVRWEVWWQTFRATPALCEWQRWFDHCESVAIVAWRTRAAR